MRQHLYIHWFHKCQQSKTWTVWIDSHQVSWYKTADLNQRSSFCFIGYQSNHIKKITDQSSGKTNHWLIWYWNTKPTTCCPIRTLAYFTKYYFWKALSKKRISDRLFLRRCIQTSVTNRIICSLCFYISMAYLRRTCL